MHTPDPEAQVRTRMLQLFARKLVEGLATGHHSSPQRGRGSEFHQNRLYVPGDEIRHIDWKVFGRTDRLHIREYQEEVSLRCTLVLDASASMGFVGSAGVEKMDYARKLAASLAILMMGQQDSVGLATIDTEVRDFIPPRSTPQHLQLLNHTLANTFPGRETNLGAAISALMPSFKKRGLIILISDCFGPPDEIVRAIGHLRHRRNEVIVFQIWDRDELEFPFQQWTRFENLEQPGDRQFADPVAIRNAYLNNLAAYRESLSRGCQRHRIDFEPVITDENHCDVLHRFLTRRSKS